MDAGWNGGNLLDEDPAQIGALFAELRAAAMRGRDGEQPTCLLALDLDCFRHHCERYGNAAAGSALCRFAEILARGLPPATPTARIGSDKFVALLADTPLSASLCLAERVRAAQAEAAAADLPDLTVSIGVADAVGLHGESAAAALDRAGAALLRAKREGRNRTKVAPPPRPQPSWAGGPG